MRIEDHISAIEDALDDFACDSTVPLSEYVEAMEQLAHQVTASLRAAHDDLVNT